MEDAPPASHPLTAYRDRHGLSKAELARRVGVSTSHVLRIEARQLKPSYDVMRSIMLATDRQVTADMLIDAGPATTSEST